MLCNSCGKELQPGQTYCGCGTAVGKMPSRVARHRRRLGILWMVYAVFPLFFGIVMLYGTLPLVPGGRSFHLEDGVLVPYTPFENALPAVASALVLVWGIVSMMAGWGLLQRVPWGRILAVVVGIFSLFSILFGTVTILFTILSVFSNLFGTALGIYTLWVLMSRDAKREYDALRPQIPNT